MGVPITLYRRELLKGNTETLLLALLVDKPQYGYQLVREIEERSSGYFRLKEGTLYPALHRLERDGMLVGRWQEPLAGQTGKSRRYYFVTDLGRRHLETMLEEWGRFTTAVNLIAHPDAN